MFDAGSWLLPVVMADMRIKRAKENVVNLGDFPQFASTIAYFTKPCRAFPRPIVQAIHDRGEQHDAPKRRLFDAEDDVIPRPVKRVAEKDEADALVIEEPPNARETYGALVH